MIRTPRLSILALFIVATWCIAATRADDAAKPDESWNAIFMGEDKVGYVHSITTNEKENNRDVVHVRVETVMNIKRFGQSIEMKMEIDSFETPEGALLRMDHRSPGQRIRGEVKDKTMHVTVETLGKQQTQTMPWSGDVLGPGAEDRLLKRQPLKAGEKRTFRSFNPELGMRIISTSLYGEEAEEVALLDGGKKKLQRVRVAIEDVPQLKNIKTTYWVDDSGEMLKSHTTLLVGMTTYRVTKDTAMAPASSFSTDFAVQTLVKVDKKIPMAYDAAEIVYRVKWDAGEGKEGDPKEIIPQDDRQFFTRAEDGGTLLVIRAVDATRPSTSPEPADLAMFRRSNNQLQSDNEKVVAVAKAAVGDATDPWQKAVRIEKWVFQNLKEKNFSKAFDSAAVVAETLEGDCTEHGVLLAAMARAAGIPSRVATGLVYADRLGAFGYHLWTEVYVNGRWVPLDGTLGRGHASPTHIKITDSSLDGVDGYTATFLPVVPVLGRLKLEVVSWKHAGQ
jgi:hypothetical protein